MAELKAKKSGSELCNFRESAEFKSDLEKESVEKGYKTLSSYIRLIVKMFHKQAPKNENGFFNG